jgi:hypothetical protein
MSGFKRSWVVRIGEKMSNLSAAMYFLDKLQKEDIVEIEFIKKDGTIRRMKCTLNFKRIPIDKRPKNTTLQAILKLITKNKILRVFDVDKNDWRSIPFKSLIIKGPVKTT